MCGYLLNFRVVTVSYRYFSQLVKNETDLVLSPFKTHGVKLLEDLLECLEKVCSKMYFTRSPFFNFTVPTLSLVGDPLMGNGCGSLNHIFLVIPFLLTDFYSSYIYIYIYIYICIKRLPVSS